MHHALWMATRSICRMLVYSKRFDELPHTAVCAILTSVQPTQHTQNAWREEKTVTAHTRIRMQRVAKYLIYTFSKQHPPSPLPSPMRMHVSRSPASAHAKRTVTAVSIFGAATKKQKALCDSENDGFISTVPTAVTAKNPFHYANSLVLCAARGTQYVHMRAYLSQLTTATRRVFFVSISFFHIRSHYFCCCFCCCCCWT